MTDAHVHMGYFPRINHSSLMYYSPRRIVGILNRCGVDEFIVSSTSAQVDAIRLSDIIFEAEELKRLAGRRAHVFFWLSWNLYKQDRELEWMSSGMFDGVKLHEKETPWLSAHKKELALILAKLEERGVPVQFHSGNDIGCRPVDLEILAKRFPCLRFDFAHCRDMLSSAKVLAECPNVYVDTAYMSNKSIQQLSKFDWHGRLMFGSDIPIWQAYEEIALTQKYRSMVRCFNRVGLSSDAAFKSFVGCS